MEQRKLQLYVNDFVEERLQESYKELLENVSFKKTINNYHKLFEELKKHVKNKRLIENFVAAEADAYTIQLVKAYKTGIKDSISMLNKF